MPELFSPHEITCVARVVLAANTTYVQSLGEWVAGGWSEAPESDKKSILAGVEHQLTELQLGNEVSPSESHQRWLTRKRLGGWKYGEVKKPEQKEHPCCVPYEELPEDQKLKDHLFVGIVGAFYNARMDAIARERKKALRETRQIQTGLGPDVRQQLRSKLGPLLDETSASDICLALVDVLEAAGNLKGAENLRRFLTPPF